MTARGWMKDLTMAVGGVTLAMALTGCDDDPTGPAPQAGIETAVVVNSIALSVTVFPVDSPQRARTIGLAPAGTPASLAVRGNLAAVPLGLFPALAVVDLSTGDVRTVPLRNNSGATGAAFLNDSIVYVADSNLNSLSRVNVFSLQVEAEIAVGIFPQAVAVAEGRVFVMNAELDLAFRPARNGVVSVVDPTTNTVASSIFLTGFNPSAVAPGPDGLLYVVNSGTFGQGDGSLSVVDPATLAEDEHHAGFGEFPGGIAFGPDGHAYVSAFSYGVAIWNASDDAFLRPPANPLVIQGHMTSSGVGFDTSGRLYSLIPGDCINPSMVMRLNADLSFDREIDVGVCPIAIAFTRLEAP